MTDIADPSAPAAVETPADFGTDTGAECRRWLAEITAAQKGDVADYHTRCDAIEKRYREQNADRDNTKRRFAMLWANTETLKPAVYARTPKPVVVTRHKDGDPVARVAAEVLERTLAYMLDSYDFDGRMQSARDDFVLFARGVLWARYDAQMQEQKVQSETAQCDFVDRKDWGHNKARTWQEVRFVFRRVFMTRDEMRARFKGIPVDRITLDHEVADSQRDDGAPDDLFRKATIYEIWDKNSRSVIWVAKSFRESVLDKRKDPLGLADFFPCPKPAYGSMSTSSLVPTPDFVYYQDQADEIDRLTQRISLLAGALKMVGWYAADEKRSIQQLLRPEAENELIPVDHWAAIGDKGGVKGLIEWLPIDIVIVTMKGCIETRRQIIDDVYQITGISDIVRGASNPNETATAQNIKNQWGSLRVRDRQNEIQRLARDVVRIKGEIAAELFGQPTLAAMSGVKLPTRADKHVAAIKLMLAQQGAAPSAVQPNSGWGNPSPAALGVAKQPVVATPQPIPRGAPPPQAAQQVAQPDIEELTRTLELPAWEDVIALLRADPQRRFVIDIETDSTIAADEQQDKQNRIEFLQATSQFLQQAGPVVQAAPELAPMMSQLLLFGVRTFRAGRELEESIEQGMQSLAARAKQALEAQANGPPPDPRLQAMMAETQRKAAADQAKAASDQANAQVAAAKVQSDHQVAMADAQATMAGHQAHLQGVQAKAGVDAQRAQSEAQLAAGELALQHAHLGIEAQRALTERDKAAGDLLVKHRQLAQADQHHAQDAEAQAAALRAKTMQPKPSGQG